MALEGDLSEISVNSLVQLACQEERRAALYLSGHDAEGVVYFEAGQIVHAGLGSQFGEQAFYQLVGWNSGRFRLRFEIEAPQRSITVPWSHLLLEASRRSDEERAGHELQASELGRDRPADAAQDGALSDEMVLLLSRLEHSRATLTDGAAGWDPAAVMEALIGMLHRAHEVYERRPSLQKGAFTPSPALLETINQHPVVGQVLQTAGNLSKFDSAQIRRAAQQEGLDLPQLFHHIGLGLVELLRTYLSGLSTGFGSAQLQDQWSATCAAFLEELALVIRDPQLESLGETN